ncbi:hypothetical protein GCM10010466_02070 [Planomonospora alba]|uniref:Uncharacterized protein n=1 Tax=Planomonospora alba TaxID=161354 RepID=A0ABP6MHT5_9ACTN
MRFLAAPVAACLLLTAAPATAAAPPAPRVPAGTTAGYAVFDRQANRIVAHRGAHRRFRSASVVKLLIAIDLLESRRTLPAPDRALLKAMLRVSDDDAATAFWNRGGQRRIVQRTARRLGLTDTAPPPADRPGFWGYTSLSAMDVVTVYRYLLDRAEPRVRDVILGHLRRAGRCGSDGFDQSFGIPSGVPGPSAVKQGWSGYGAAPPARCARPAASPAAPPSAASPAAVPAARWAPPSPEAAPVAVPAATTAGTASAGSAGPVPDLGRPVLHTTGLAGRGERWIMVLLTAHPAGSTWGRSTARTTALARDLYRGVAR